MAMLASFAESKHAVIRYNWLTGKREIVAGKHNISGLSVAYTPEEVGGILKECLKIRMRGGKKIDKCQEPDRIATTKCSGRASNFCANFGLASTRNLRIANQNSLLPTGEFIT